MNNDINCLEILYSVNLQDLNNLPIGLKVLMLRDLDDIKDMNCNLPITFEHLFVQYTTIHTHNIEVISNTLHKIKIPLGCKLHLLISTICQCCRMVYLDGIQHLNTTTNSKKKRIFDGLFCFLKRSMKYIKLDYNERILNEKCNMYLSQLEFCKNWLST